MIHTVNLFIFLVLFIFVINKILSYLMSPTGLQLFILLHFLNSPKLILVAVKYLKTLNFLS